MTLLHHLPPPPLMLLFLTGLYLSCRKWRCQCCVRRDIRRGEHTVLHQVDDTGRGFFWRHCDCVQVCHVRGRRRRARGSHLKLIHPSLIFQQILQCNFTYAPPTTSVPAQSVPTSPSKPVTTPALDQPPKPPGLNQTQQIAVDISQSKSDEAALTKPAVAPSASATKETPPSVQANAAKTQMKPAATAAEKKSALQRLVSLGFTKTVAQKTLEACNWDLAEAALMLFEKKGVPRPDAVVATKPAEEEKGGDADATKESFMAPSASTDTTPVESPPATSTNTSQPGLGLTQTAVAPPPDHTPAQPSQSAAPEADLEAGDDHTNVVLTLPAQPGFQVVASIYCHANGARLCHHHTLLQTTAYIDSFRVDRVITMKINAKFGLLLVSNSAGLVAVDIKSQIKYALLPTTLLSEAKGEIARVSNLIDIDTYYRCAQQRQAECGGRPNHPYIQPRFADRGKHSKYRSQMI